MALSASASPRTHSMTLFPSSRAQATSTTCAGASVRCKSRRVSRLPTWSIRLYGNIWARLSCEGCGIPSSVSVDEPSRARKPLSPPASREFVGVQTALRSRSNPDHSPRILANPPGAHDPKLMMIKRLPSTHLNGSPGPSHSELDHFPLPRPYGTRLALHTFVSFGTLFSEGNPQ